MPKFTSNIFCVVKHHVSKLAMTSKDEVLFNDVIECEDVTHECLEFVAFLQNPKNYQEFGANILHKGALLACPTGTRKTLLAKAMVNASFVSFLSICDCDFMELFVGIWYKSHSSHDWICF